MAKKKETTPQEEAQEKLPFTVEDLQEKTSRELSESLDKYMDKRLNNHEREVYEKRIKDIIRLAKHLQDELSEARNLRNGVFELAQTPLEFPNWMVEAGISKEYQPQIPVLITSDFHYGEVVDPNEMDQFNCYNPEVANKRIERLAKNTIMKLRSRGDKRPAGIVLCRLGDTVSGDIHDELKETNALTPLEAAKGCAEQEIKMIEEFRKEFKNVHLISVPGNHGRTSEKKQSKKVVATNYDDICTYIIEKHFQKVKGVTFCTPPSGEASWSIYNTNFFAQHGDRIGSSGGAGLVGPSHTIGRGQLKTMLSRIPLKKEFDWMLIGHFHTHIKLENVIANASLVGYGEYARDIRAKPRFASQTLFMVSPDMGVADVSEIFVTNKNQLKEDMKIFYASKRYKRIKIAQQPAWMGRKANSASNDNQRGGLSNGRAG